MDQTTSFPEDTRVRSTRLTTYSIDGPAQKILDAGGEGFIQKPFLIAALAEKLKEVLEEK